MYLQHFDFDRPPFDGGIAQDMDVFLGPRHEEILDHFAIALSTHNSMLALTGAPGVGKTTLACTAVRASATRLALGWVGTPPGTPQDLLEQLLAEFDVGGTRGGRSERLQTWRQFLSEMSATESRVIVIVENAQDVPADVLRVLESLTAADPSGCPGANVVLTGTPAFAELLDAPPLRSLRQRIRLRQTLEPLDEAETGRYVEHRIARAGGDFAALVDADAVTAMHRFTGGVPRVLNNLCETAFSLAARRGLPKLSAELVARVATELLGLAEPQPAAPGPASLAAVVPGPGAERRPAAAPVVDLPVLTDAVEPPAPVRAQAPSPGAALLRDALLEEARARVRRSEEELSFQAADEALAEEPASVRLRVGAR
ncbi:MAG TPA: AAA family ATPase [Gammaproteobacteria bacterium]